MQNKKRLHGYNEKMTFSEKVEMRILYYVLFLFSFSDDNDEAVPSGMTIDEIREIMMQVLFYVIIMSFQKRFSLLFGKSCLVFFP